MIDIGRIAELKGITADSGMVRVGALTTHAELASHPVIREYCSALADAAAQVGDPAVRNRGTIGGNVAHADPASDLPTVLTALGARFSVVGPGGSRTIEAASFFQGMMATALGEHDLLVAVEVPSHAGQGMAYVKFVHPASRYAVIGVAAVVAASGGKCTRASVVVGGLVPQPVRAGSVEKALVGQALTPRRHRERRRARSRRISAATSSATSTPRPSTGARWHRSGSGGRSRLRQEWS